jgi:hypothetical protein
MICPQSSGRRTLRAPFPSAMVPLRTRVKPRAPAPQPSLARPPSPGSPQLHELPALRAPSHLSARLAPASPWGPRIRLAQAPPLRPLASAFARRRPIASPAPSYRLPGAPPSPSPSEHPVRVAFASASASASPLAFVSPLAGALGEHRRSDCAKRRSSHGFRPIRPRF